MSVIPLVDLKAQFATIREEVEAAVRRVLERQHFIGGEEVSGFEEEFAAWLEVDGAVGVASGTAAIHLALRACGIGEGDEVIVPTWTFAATAEAVYHAGARPVLVDVKPSTGNLDPDAVEAAVTERTRAIVCVHLYGHPADMSALKAIADRHDLRLIEDAAQAHGARYEGRLCGGLGDLACFSFFPSKNLGAYGDGGAVTGSDADLLAAVRRLRDHGRTSKYHHEEIGWGERLDALQAAILRVKLPHLEGWIEARRAHAARYGALLAETGLLLPPDPEHVQHAYHLYVVRVPKALGAGRDALLEHLVARGVQAGVHYPYPLHRLPAFEREAQRESKLPASEAWAEEALSLPLYPELTGAQLERVAEVVKEGLV